MTLAGLRPGEKLFEEKLMAEEGLKKTKNKLIHIGCPIPFNTEQFLQQLTVLMKAAYDNDQNIREMVELIVPTYHPEEKNVKKTILTLIGLIVVIVLGIKLLSTLEIFAGVNDRLISLKRTMSDILYILIMPEHPEKKTWM